MSEESNGQDKLEIFKLDELRAEREAAARRVVRPLHAGRSPDFFAWWQVIRRRRRTVLAAFVILFGLVLAGTLRQKPIYRAKALIEIDRDSPGLVTAQELLQLDDVSDSYLETQYKVLASDDLAERVIRQLHLDRNSEFLPSPPMWLWAPMRALASVREPVPTSDAERNRQEEVIARFEERLDIRPFRHSRAVEIRFDCLNPELATAVVNSVTENYIQKNLEARWQSTQKTSEWLTQQLQDLKSKLATSEDDLQKYAAANGLLYLETDKGNTESILNQSLRELQEELTRAQADRYEKESLFRLVQSGDYGSLPGVVDNRLMQDLSERLSDLERQHAQLAATFTDEYPKMKEFESQIKEVEASLSQERWRAAQKISNDYFAALRREKLVQQAFAEKQSQTNQVAEKSVQYGILSRDVDSNKDLYDGLLQRVKEAGVSAGLKASNIRVVDPGRASYKPVAPILWLNLSLAGLVGAGMGIGMAFLQERLDQSIRSASDVEEFLNLPVLGSIPAFEPRPIRKDKRDNPRQLFPSRIDVTAASAGLMLDRAQTQAGMRNAAALSEAFQELRTSVILSGSGRFANSILVTSASAGEGKTSVAVNLAASLAQLGQPVLLVDTDLRRPSLQKHFPQRGSYLSSYLSGQGSWQEMVYPTSISRLYVMHAGPVPENPSELLCSDRMRALIRESIATYRFVILDSAPLLNGADSRIVGSMAGATLLVVKAGETPRQVVQYAGSQARSVGTNLIGVVLNNIHASWNEYSRYASQRSSAIPAA